MFDNTVGISIVNSDKTLNPPTLIMKISKVLALVGILLVIVTTFVEILCPKSFLFLPGWFILGLIAFYLCLRSLKGELCTECIWSRAVTTDFIIVMSLGPISFVGMLFVLALDWVGRRNFWR